MKTFFKNPKKPILRPFRPFFPKFGQNWIFLEKKALSVFEYCNYLPSCQKSEETNVPFLKNADLMDGLTERRKDKQATMIL